MNVIAFEKRQRAILAGVKKGDTVCVMGTITAAYYKIRSKEHRYSRTLIADGVIALPNAGVGGRQGTEPVRETRDAIAGLADELIPEAGTPGADGFPSLED